MKAEIIPIHRLTKQQLVWMANHTCKKHRHKYIEHYQCYVNECQIPERVGYLDIEASNLDADFGIMLCIDPKTKVLTSNLRWVNASTIKTGDEIIGVNEYPELNKKGEKRRLLRTIVENIDVIEQPKLRIYTTEGSTIVSEGHRFLVYSSHTGGYIWKEAIKLNEGDLIRYCVKPWEITDSWYSGWLAGIADGEGCLYQGDRKGHVRLSISQSNKQGFAAIIREHLKLNGYPFYESLNKTDVVNFYLQSGKVLEFLGKERPIRLLSKFIEAIDNTRLGLPYDPTYARIQKVKKIGIGPVITIGTTSRTLITDGFVSHNSWCIKDGASSTIHNSVLTKDDIDSAKLGQEDKRIVKELIECLGQYDRIVTYYGKNFDVPFIRARALIDGIRFPNYGTLLHTDLYFVIRSRFKLSSKRLENACRVLLGKTQKTRINTAYWRAAVRGCKKALDYVVNHNKYDVLDLEKLYKKVINFSKKNDQSI